MRLAALKYNYINKIMQQTSKNMLSAAEAAVFLGMSKSYLYKLTSSRRVPYYKPNGKRIYFNRAELEEWMSQNRIMTDEEIKDHVQERFKN